MDWSGSLMRYVKIATLLLSLALSACAPLTPRGGSSAAEWAPSPNFGVRRANYVILHHTSNDTLAQAQRTLSDPERNNKIDFTAKNLTSNAGLFLLLENAKSNEIFDLVEDDLVFDNDSTNKIKMNHIKTMICGHFIGIDKLERLKLLQNDPLVNEFDISVKEPETVSRFLGNFTFKTTQMFRDINFKVFKKLLTKSKLTSITINIDSTVINVEGHQ